MRPQQKLTTYALQNNQGPEVLSHELTNAIGQKGIILEAWMSNFGGSNIYLFEGDLTIEQCKDLLDDNGPVNCLMPVTGSGPTKIQVNLNEPRLTIFFEAKNESGQTQTICIREHEII